MQFKKLNKKRKSVFLVFFFLLFFYGLSIYFLRKLPFSLSEAIPHLIPYHRYPQNRSEYLMPSRKYQYIFQNNSLIIIFFIFRNIKSDISIFPS